MTPATDQLLAKLKESALMVLRRHGVGEDEVQIEKNSPKELPSWLIKGHRVRIHVDEASATFAVRAGRWRGACADYPTAGAFIADFEDQLNRALSS